MRPRLLTIFVEALEDRRLLAAFDVLVFSRTAGFRHDSIDEGVAAIQALGSANDFTVAATENPTAFTDANLAQYEAVVFLMTTGDVLNATQQAAFERFIAAGKGYVGVHSAADTEYDWPFYGELVGAYFEDHPAIQQATVTVADRVHPATAHLPQRWVRTDEWYDYRANPRGDVHVLATLDERTYSGGDMGFDHPIAWCQPYAGGRSFYTGLGHTAASYSEPLFRQHLLGGIRYAAGAVAADDGATMTGNFRKTVLEDETSHPFQLDLAPDGRVFFAERFGAVKLWDPATSLTRTIADIPVYGGSEDGLLGLALDPNFATNGWVYLFYAASSVSEQYLSRFTFDGTSLDRASERVLLRVPVQRSNSYHSAGALDFGPDGTLYVSTGDNTRPFESDGFAPIDERAGRSDWDAQKSSSNTQDLRGKILRVRPQADGTYTIPAGNLFPADGAQGRPEIYAMGLRNPFRFSVDPETGWLYAGDVGPDANAAVASRGPAGHDEFNQVRSAGNYGWPYFVADNRPYVDYNFATGVSGSPFNPAAPVNNSPNNTGLAALPPARPAWIWYPYGASTTFPELGTGGRTAMAGPVYHYSAAGGSPFKLPAYYDDTLFVYEWSRNWIKEVKIDAASGAVLKINPFAPGVQVGHPMDMKIGPDGAMYLLEWGPGFGDAGARLVRIEYLANDPPLRVEAVYVRGGTWAGRDGDPANVTFMEHLHAAGIGSDVLGYRVDNVAADATLPWTNVDQVVVRYSAAVTAGMLSPASFALDGVRSDYALADVTQLDARTVSLALPRPLGARPAGGVEGDRVQLRVPGAGPAGGDYRLLLHVLPGDADRGNGRVNANDLGTVRSRQNRTASETPPAGLAPYSPFADVDATGRINANDVGSVRARQNTSLPEVQLAQPPAVSATGWPPRLDRPSLTRDLFGSEPLIAP